MLHKLTGFSFFFLVIYVFWYNCERSWIFLFATSMITKRGSLLTVIVQDGILVLSVTDKGRLKIIRLHVLLLLVSHCFFLTSCESILAQIPLLIHFWVILILLFMFDSNYCPWFLMVCSRSVQTGECIQVDFSWCPWTIVGSFRKFWKFLFKSKLIVNFCSSIIEFCSIMKMDDQHVACPAKCASSICETYFHSKQSWDLY